MPTITPTSCAEKGLRVVNTRCYQRDDSKHTGYPEGGGT